MTGAALQADTANAGCTSTEKRWNLVHLLPSLGVADMQSDRQKVAGQKKRGKEEEKWPSLSAEQKDGKPKVV